MTAEELAKRYQMEPHVENGTFSERHYVHKGPGRAASGSIYYYVAPDSRTEFHRIDCDEYWCYAAGAPLEVWQADPDGNVTVTRLGIEPGCEPIVYVPKGTTFASRSGHAQDGTFLSCITVPRFTYEGFTMISGKEMLEEIPALAPFFEDTAWEP